ncbi:MAG: ferredoxin, partial [Mycobacterium sp.]|nr:ferredoxin [Mycobacterium sp.]
MTVRPDNRLLDAAPVPVHCRRCEATVQVRKSSWAQTSVQWDAAAMAACAQRRAATALAGHDNGPFLVCSDLRAAIEDAARRGEVPI